jgi:SAM-dependent methyltransferase
MNSGVSREDVEAAYRLILGRTPESEEAITFHQSSPDIAALRQTFLRSPELQSEVGGLPLNLPFLDVEFATSADTLNLMLAKTAAYWNRIGSEAPHWSVLVDEMFSPANILANQEKFFESSKIDEEILIASLARAGFRPSDFRSCVEFGCGVGRLTFRLSSLFQSVIGLDISQPHLRLAQEYCARLGLNNVNFSQVSAANLMPAAGFDFWFSRLVLQHNPPPVAMAILKRAFRSLPLGGVAMFQVPVYKTGYQFSAQAYLASSLGEVMEMHCLPQKAIFDEAHRCGMRLLDIREDTSWSIGQQWEWLSNNFLFLKTSASAD